MSVTIRMIAEKCGVSRGTVDRVINHRGRVSAETARRVNEAIEELGYRPNTIGHALAMQKKRMRIGVILCSVGNEFYDDIIAGLNAAEAENSNYNIEVLYRNMKGYDLDEQLRLMDELESQVNCLILTAIDDILIAQKIDEYMEKGIGVFTLNTDIIGSKRICHVGVDVVECGSIACGLIALLCREQGRVLITTGSLSLLEHRNRILGFCNTLNERYPKIKIAEIIETQDDNEEAYRRMSEFLDGGVEVQAVFNAGGGTPGICRALKEHDMGQIRVVVCDTMPEVKKLVNEKRVQATIDQQPWRQGYQVLRLAVQYLVDGTIRPNEVIENEIKLFENIV